MTHFTLKLAGIPFAVNAIYPSTAVFCRSYLTEEPPLFSVTVLPSHVDARRERDRQTALAEGRIPADMPDGYLETLALADLAMDALLHRGVLLFHGSVMAVGGRAYLFTAKSGTGKTTHSRLWLKAVPDCHILNGDKPLLLFDGGRVFACGSPWQGKEQYGVNETLPLGGICFLERSRDNHMEKITLNECLGGILGQCHLPEGNGAVVSALRLVRQLENVPIYRLGCNMEESAALLSYRTMVTQ